MADGVQADDGRSAADVVVGEAHTVDGDEAARVGGPDGVTAEGTAGGAGFERNDAGGRGSGHEGHGHG